jgi:formylglycine-generating enzyme required for sulfatase activity
MPQVFLCHSEKDAGIAQQLADDLRAVGVPVWKAPESILPGEGWVAAIERGLKTSTHLVLLMSVDAVESAWVNWEFDIAVILETRKKIVILPVDYQPCEPPLRWERYMRLTGICDDYAACVLNLLKRIQSERPAEPAAGITLHIEGDVNGNVTVAGGNITYADRPESPPEVPEISEPPALPEPESKKTASDMYRAAEEACHRGDYQLALQELDNLKSKHPRFQSDQVKGLVERIRALMEYIDVYQQISLLVRVASARGSARSMLVELRNRYPYINHDPNNLMRTLDVRFGFEPETVPIPAGPFLMGSPEGDDRHVNCEPGQFELTLDYDYAIGKYPVTVGQYRAFVDAGGYDDERWWTKAGWRRRESEGWTQPRYWDDQKWAGDDNLPVVGVSWYEAYAYTRWLSDVTGCEYRLPTEAEWEKAARGGLKIPNARGGMKNNPNPSRIWPWGDEPPTDQLCCFEENSDRTSPVTSHPAQARQQPYGLYHMAGNVWEWCLSKWAAPFTHPEVNHPEGDGVRVLRGGSFDYDAVKARCSSRGTGSPYKEGHNRGFRVVDSS